MPNPSKTRHGLVIDRGIKFMKKRLLITSIVMMLVVAVALSTATYAWFTSNAGVTASSVQLTAASNADASIGIAWGSDPLSSAISAQGPAQNATWAPMAPPTCANGTTAYGEQFKTATTRASGSNYVFNGPENATPFYYQSSSNDAYFRVANTSTSNAATVTLTLADVTNSTVASDTNNLLRVGVFTCATASGDYKLAKVLSVTDDQAVAYGTITQGNNIADLVPVANTYLTDTSYSFDLAASTGVLYFKVIAWMDGYALNDGNASSTATFGLNFSAVKKVD